MRLLSSGLSNDNYVMGHCQPGNCQPGNRVQNHYAVRVNRDVSSLGVGRENEVWAWRQAASGGLAPELLWVSPDYHCYLSRYVADASLNIVNTAGTMRSGAMIAALLAGPLPTAPSSRAVTRLQELLCQLAALPVPELTVSTLEQWQTYYSALQASVTSASADVQQAICRVFDRRPQILEWITTMTDAQQGRWQFCHRDLNPCNVLWPADHPCLAIDFEYTCSAGPLNELATVLATHGWSATDTRWLCREYLTQLGLTDMPHQAIAAAVNMYWIFSCCWALLQAVAHKEQQHMDWFRQSELMLP
ncbi:MAG: aminoglycoside phosphotransferase family protein [Shewanella sp.]|nr:aminoglycoside phosphotransferase family protein [Shewanella sp.]MCF1430503.1 aminoglycoside phosphotransferase family protein [Shewanella sp.]MCF1439290.1 aminoglycoside phosphotransferase family protein [Shewanella sp.]